MPHQPPRLDGRVIVNRNPHRRAAAPLGLALAALLTGCGGPPEQGAPAEPVAQNPAPDKQPPPPVKPPPARDKRPPAPAAPQPPNAGFGVEPKPQPPKPADAPPRPKAAADAKRFELKRDLFKIVQATDGTFTMKVPADWTVHSAEIDNLRIWSPSGEALFMYTLPIPGDQRTLNMKLQGEQTLRQFAGQPPMPREQVQAMARCVSPYLPPEKVVTVYWPQVTPAVQDVKIKDTQDAPDAEKKLLQLINGREAIFHYQFTFKVKPLNKWEREQINPALARLEEAAMEGRAKVTTAPSPFANAPQIAGLGANNWVLTVQGEEGPEELFQKNQVLYEAMWRSMKIDVEAVGRKYQMQADAIQNVGHAFMDASADAMRTNTAVAQYANDILGDRRPYYDPTDNQLYTVTPEEADALGPGDVVLPNGHMGRPASIDDIKRMLPSLFPGE